MEFVGRDIRSEFGGEPHARMCRLMPVKVECESWKKKVWKLGDLVTLRLKPQATSEAAFGRDNTTLDLVTLAVSFNSRRQRFLRDDL